MRVAGLAPVEGIPGLENIDVTKLVNGHMAYRAAMPRLLREVGWEVESDEFTEIEDPDPDNHDKRQRELIRELDEARKEAEAKPEKKRFGLFKRGKLAQKKGWETYDDSMRTGENGTAASATGDDANSNGNNNVLFDIDAIRAELASEQIEVRQLESTLPPMKLEINGAKSSAEWNAQLPPPLRETKSYDASMVTKLSADMNRMNAKSDTEVHQSAGNPFSQGYDEYNVSNESAIVSRPNGVYTDDDNASHGVSNASFASRQQQQQWPASSTVSPAATSNTRVDWPGSSSTVSPVTSPTPNLDLDSVHHSPSRSQQQAQPQRPPLVSSNTLPVEHNAWLDEEDEGFGKEGEVKMTFG